MEQFILTLIGIPFLAFVCSLFVPGKKEHTIALIVKLATGINLLVAIAFSIAWVLQGANSIHFTEMTVLESGHYVFHLDLFADKLSITFLLVGSILLFLIAIFSRRYLHRETGYKRFFNVFLFFVFGYLLILFSGNFETMFMGWEVLGLSSFLLIAFYRDRYLPVKNAVKVFSIYRIGDVGLILTMWLSHHLWGQNVAFHELTDVKGIHSALINHSGEASVIALLLFLAVSAKSALFPFSSWLPRAMEGPTPSSAIFYGSLSVHIGVFLLIRTMPYWEDQLLVRWIFGSIGLITFVFANFTARVQSTIKSQVGYASIAQIGIIVIEVALGWEDVALVHSAANAFYRSYQLLISPSVVTYKIREQFYHFEKRNATIEDSWPKRLEYTLYIWSIQEWRLDSGMYRWLWNPLKKIGNLLQFLSNKWAFLVVIPVMLAGILLLTLHTELPKFWLDWLPNIFAVIGLAAVLKAFTERKHVFASWMLVLFNQFCILLAIAFNEHLSGLELTIFLSGILVSGIIGLLALNHLRRKEGAIHLDAFQGHVYEHKRIALMFLLACLGIAGFPITPTFIGEDLLFSHIGENQIFLATMVAISFIVDGIALIRLYARIFLGPHIKNYHEVAKRSS